MKVKLHLKQPLKKLKITKTGIQVVEPWILELYQIKPAAKHILEEFLKLEVDPFLELVSKSEYPDYYKIIEHPISLKEIRLKVDKMQYVQIDDFKADIQLMLSNCLKYNVPTSYLGVLAQKLQTQFNKIWEEERQKRTESKEKKLDILQDLFDCIECDDFKNFETLFLPDHVNQLHKIRMFDEEFTWGLLHACCYYGRTRFIEFLMERKANVELQDTWYGGRPLAWATFGKFPKICKLLIEKYGADKNSKNNHGQTAFDLIEDKTAVQWRDFFKPEKKSSNVTIKIPPQTERPKPATQVYQTPVTQRFVIPASSRPSTANRKVVFDQKASKAYTAQPTPHQTVPTPTQDMFQQFIKSAQLLPQEQLIDSIGTFVLLDITSPSEPSYSLQLDLSQDIKNNFQGHCITVSTDKLVFSLKTNHQPVKISGFHTCQLNVKQPDGYRLQQRQEAIDFQDHQCEILLQSQLNTLEFIVQKATVQHSFLILVYRI